MFINGKKAERPNAVYRVGKLAVALYPHVNEIQTEQRGAFIHENEKKIDETIYLVQKNEEKKSPLYSTNIDTHIHI